MNEDLERRKHDLRREIASRIEAAKELGDLSENFEYHEAKEQQALNETKIAELEHMVKDVVLVEQQSGGSEISLGTTFSVVCQGIEKTFEMVGSSEADPVNGKISNESPLGLAFMGHKIGAKVEVKVPSGIMVYEIKDIR